MRPDAVSALAAYVEREAVSSARFVAIKPAGGGGAVAEMSAGDGSRWYVATDAYGTAFGWSGTIDDAIRQVVDQLTARAAEPTGWMARAILGEGAGDA